MIFFHVLKDVQVISRGTGDVIRFRAPRSQVTGIHDLATTQIYLTTHAQYARLVKAIPDAQSVLRVLDDLAVDMIRHQDAFPVEITFYQQGEVQEIFRQHGKSARIAVINGMGFGIGDSIVGLQALDIFHRRIRTNYKRISIDMFQRIKPELRPLYQRSNAVNQVYDMPQTLAKLLGYDYSMSLEAFTASPQFNSMPMIDYFLAKLGLDPANIAADEKRCRFLARTHLANKGGKAVDDLLASFKNRGCRLLLMHPFASDAVRSVPDDHLKTLLDYLIGHTDYILVGALDITYENKRYINLASMSKTVEDFISIVSRMDAVITVDTSTYHIADCFNIPTVVLFNTIDPHFRTVYYPHTRGIWLAEGRDSLATRHKGFTERDRVELDAVYKQFDHERLLRELDLAIESIRSGAT